MNQRTSQIVEGGCYHGSPLRPPTFRRLWVVAAIVLFIAVAAFALWRK